MNLISPLRLSAAALKIEAMNMTGRLLQGSRIQEYLEQIAQLKLSIFKEYPNLNDGHLKDELDYLRHYANHDEAITIIASCGNELAGAVTAIPLQCESEALTFPCAATQYRHLCDGLAIRPAGFRHKVTRQHSERPPFG